MAAFVFISIGLLVMLLYVILTQPASKGAALLVNGGPVLLIAAGILLTLLRRGALGIPLILIGITWWRRTRAPRSVRPPGGSKSTVHSSNLEMELDHDTGELDGRVLTGRFQGFRLSALNEDELLSFLQEIKSDPDSLALLESYLERYHPGWQDRAKNFTSGGTGSSDPSHMSKQEAYQVLGVSPGASREEILEAWRRLIKKVHPDSGGSAFLTAKINAAKKVLLSE